MGRASRPFFMENEMQKQKEPVRPNTITITPTRADTVETDEEGNVLSVNGVPVEVAEIDPATLRDLESRN